MTTPTVKVENLLGMLTIKLKDDNFAKWAFQFKAVLKGYKLFGHFDGTDVCPSKFIITTDLGVTEEVTKAYIDWESTDMALLSLFLATLSDEVMEYVLGCKNAHEAWVNLVDREQLSVVGEYISDNDVIITGLVGLPKEYAIIRIVIRARESSITLKSLKHNFLVLKRKLKEKSIQEIKIQIMALPLRVKTITGPVMDTRGGISILEGTSRTQITMVGLETQIQG
ncbi:uncharacterized protein [Malus domestica]|uniref:uncharacterized protein n=1 Tax=Malus domestica TaxID=3750 RepID=UPI0039748132